MRNSGSALTHLTCHEHTHTHTCSVSSVFSLAGEFVRTKSSPSNGFSLSSHPHGRARLDAVKAQMEDSSLKVEVAEQEMRKAVQSMREEQHALGLKAGMRQRSLIDMHDLIHGLREEQQQAKAALHACQMALCVARAWQRCTRPSAGRGIASAARCAAGFARCTHLAQPSLMLKSAVWKRRRICRITENWTVGSVAHRA